MNLGAIELKLHEVHFEAQFWPNVNEETAKYTQPCLRGEAYLAVGELILAKSRWSYDILSYCEALHSVTISYCEMYLT